MASVRVVRVMAAGYPEAGRARAGFRGIRERGIRGRWWWAAVVVGGRARAGVWVSGRARGVVGAAERARNPRMQRDAGGIATWLGCAAERVGRQGRGQSTFGP